MRNALQGEENQINSTIFPLRTIKVAEAYISPGNVYMVAGDMSG